MVDDGRVNQLCPQGCFGSGSRSHTSAARLRFALLVGALALGLLIISAGSAQAQSGPTDAQYEDQVTQLVGDGGGADAAAETGAPADAAVPALEQNIVGSLPITGLDVLALGAVALALMLMGLGLRRMTAIDDDLD